MTAVATNGLALGDLPALLAGRAGDLFAEPHLAEVPPTYIRLKDDAAVVGFGLIGYVRTFSSPERARVVAAKGSRLRPPARLLPGQRSVLYRFPADAVLGRADRVVRVRSLKRLLAPLPWLGDAGWRVRSSDSSLEVLRYKPERRIVARAELGLCNDGTGARDRRTVVLRRYGSSGAAAQLQRRLELLAPVQPGLAPAPLGVAGDERLSVESAIAGQTLGLSLLGGEVDGQPVARLLVDLHRSAVTFDTVMGRGDRLGAALRALAALARAHPPIVPAAEQLGRRLEELAGAAPDPAVGPVHGDVHADQVVLSPEGPVLVDFDRAAMGDPLADVAGLVAHLRARAMEEPEVRHRLDDFAGAFLDSYARSSAVPVTEAGLAFAVGCAWAEQALLRFRSLVPRWRERVEALLDPAAVASALRP